MTAMTRIAWAVAFTLALGGCGSQQSTTGGSESNTAEEPRKAAPDFELTNVAGGTIKSAELKGKVVIADFWATWCAPCIEEIPNFNSLHEAYADKGVQMLAITLDSGALEDIVPKVGEFEMKYPVLVGNDQVLEAFGGSIGFPTTYIVDQDWKIYKKYLGLTASKKERIEKDIEKLLAE
jgi:thiol-disulfide isomerase/thioredoxin